MGVEKLTIEEIAKMSIQAERNAVEMYTHLQLISTHPRGKMLYGQIARMEKGHLAALLKLFKKSLELGSEKEAERIAKASIDPGADELTILVNAMRREREACAAYEDGAKKTRDKKTRAILEDLARDEENHFDMLKGIYVQLTHREPEL